jgi:hypothetical protein
MSRIRNEYSDAYRYDRLTAGDVGFRKEPDEEEEEEEEEENDEGNGEGGDENDDQNGGYSV